jgi:PAS domain S-box-containing protein
VDLEAKNLKLIESVFSFEDIFNTTMEMILIFENDGTIIDINQSGLKMLDHYYKSEIVDTKISRYFLESDLPKVYEDLRMNTHEPYEIIVLKRNGSQFHALISTRRIVRNGKKVRLATLMDLSDLKQ